jgi:hypothetical protein
MDLQKKSLLYGLLENFVAEIECLGGRDRKSERWTYLLQVEKRAQLQSLATSRKELLLTCCYENNQIPNNYGDRKNKIGIVLIICTGLNLGTISESEPRYLKAIKMEDSKEIGEFRI